MRFGCIPYVLICLSSWSACVTAGQARVVSSNETLTSCPNETLDIQAGVTVTIQTSGNAQCRTSTIGAGSVEFSGGINNLLGTLEHSGGTTIKTGVRVKDKAPGQIDGPITIEAGGLITLRATQDFTLDNQFSGAGQITKNNPKQTKFTGISSFTGEVHINAGSFHVSGTLPSSRILVPHATGDATLVVSGNGTLSRSTIVEMGLNGHYRVLNTHEIGSLRDSTLQDGAQVGGFVWLNPNSTLKTGFDGADTSYSGFLSGAGNFEKHGTGTFTFKGTSSHSGAIIIEEGDIEIDDATFNEKTDVTINGPGHFKLLTGSATSTAKRTTTLGDVVLNTPSSGRAELTISRYNILNIDSLNTSTRSSVHINGTLHVENDANLASGTFLEFQGGQGEDTFEVGGTLNFDGAADSRGRSFYVNANKLTGTGVFTLSSTGEIIHLTLSDNSTFGGTFNGQGQIEKLGSGILTLSGASTNTGKTTITEGGINLTGSLSSDVVVASGAIFSGNGTTTGGLSGDGTVKPGNSIGTLTVGSADFSGGLTLDSELKEDGSSDLLAVTGAVSNLGSANIVIEKDATASSIHADYLGKSYTLITAASGLNATVSDSQITEGGTVHVLSDAKVDPAFANDATKFNVIIGTKPNPQVVNHVVTNHATGNSTNAGSTVQKILTNNNLANLAVTNASAGAATAQNHLEAYSSYQTVLLEHTDLTSEMVLSHTIGSDRPVGEPKAASLMAFAASDQEALGKKEAPFALFGGGNGHGAGRTWLNTSYLVGEVNGESGLGNFEYDGLAILGGTDVPVTEHLHLGVFAGYGTASMDEHDGIDQDLKSDTYHLGLYGQYDFGDGIGLAGLVGYSYSKTDSRRGNMDITTAGAAIPDSKASYGAHGAQSRFELGKTYQFDERSSITPIVGAEFAWFHQEAFDETGGGTVGGHRYDHHVDSSNYEAVVGTVGFDAEKTLEFEGGDITGDISLRYSYDVTANMDSTHTITAERLDYVGQNRGAHGLMLGMGLGIKAGSHTDIGLGVMGEKNSNGTEYGFGGSISIKW